MKRRILLGLAIAAITAWMVPTLTAGYATQDAQTEMACAKCPCGDKCPCGENCKCGDECKCPKKGKGCEKSTGGEYRELCPLGEGCKKPKGGDGGGCKGKK